MKKNKKTYENRKIKYFTTTVYLLLAIFFISYDLQIGVAIANDDTQLFREEKVDTVKEGLMSSEFSQKYEAENVTDIVKALSERITLEEGNSREEMKKIFDKKAKEIGTTTDNDVNEPKTIFSDLDEIEIEWDEVRDRIEEIHDNVNEFISSEEGQNFIHSILDVLIAFIELLRNILTP